MSLYNLDCFDLTLTKEQEQKLFVLIKENWGKHFSVPFAQRIFDILEIKIEAYNGMLVPIWLSELLLQLRIKQEIEEEKQNELV
jgi:hypothetical protein